MKIGLLSDTHGYLDPTLFTHFADCDEVWHGGDIGDPQIIHQLEKFKPLRAVFGNIDDKEVQLLAPEDLRFKCDGLSVWMTHIGGSPPRYNPRINNSFKETMPDLFVCGHTHVLKVIRDVDKQNLLYLNPGAAGNHGFHSMKTALRFEVIGKKVTSMEVIELGKRGKL